MSTAWAFVVILFATQVFHVVHPSPTPEANPYTPFVPPRPPRQPPQTNQANAESKASTTSTTTTTLKPNKPALTFADIANFHHGTLASSVPVDINKNPTLGWHVAVYTRIDDTYEQICGGSLVKKDTAISAAHCFWDEAGLMLADLFAVAVGQSQRRWEYTQRYRSNVSEIIIPPRFLGAQANFQDDIAILRLTTPVEYQFGVQPVCVSFDLKKERWHFRTGFNGIITGFGLTEENGMPSPVLNYQHLPYLEIRECIAASDPGFLKYLTSDKICAGDQKTGRALCRGDSGGGLVFYDGLIASAVMYLRGIASTAPRNNNACNAFAIGTFTSVQAHRTFLRDNIPNLEDECEAFHGYDKLNPVFKPRPVLQQSNTDESATVTNTDTQKVSDTGVQLDNNGGLNGAGNDNKLLSSQGNANSASNVQIPPLVISNTEQKPENTVDLSFLQGPIKPVSVPNGNNAGGSNEIKFKGSPNTNIFFFNGNIVDPNKLISEANAAPIVVESRPQQPTNVYVFIQN